jgi:hypothetical protein
MSSHYDYIKRINTVMPHEINLPLQAYANFQFLESNTKLLNTKSTLVKKFILN